MQDGFIKVAAGVPEIALGDCAANAHRIIAMAEEMSAKGVKLAVFTELGVTGYTLEDMFLQQTLLTAGEKALMLIMDETASLDMLLAVGVPVPVGCSLYNCAAFISKGKLLALVAFREPALGLRLLQRRGRRIDNRPCLFRSLHDLRERFLAGAAEMEHRILHHRGY